MGQISLHENVTLVTSDEILASNSVPIEILPAGGIGTKSYVLHVFMQDISGDTDYATNVTMRLKFAGTNETVATIDLSAIPSNSFAFLVPAFEMPENTALVLQTDNGDPDTGNKEFSIFIIFRTI